MSAVACFVQVLVQCCTLLAKYTWCDLMYWYTEEGKSLLRDVYCNKDAGV